MTKFSNSYNKNQIKIIFLTLPMWRIYFEKLSNIIDMIGNTPLRLNDVSEKTGCEF